MGNFITFFFQILTQILILAIVGRALLSWFPLDQRNPLVRILHDITEPILEPLRRIIPRVGMLDLTPMVAIIVLVVVQRILLN
jgi:YggT family protein